ncbi:MAG TPA: cation transporter [Bacillota bacterium]|nr:cation transporter [Bacillota bacterium]
MDDSKPSRLETQRVLSTSLYIDLCNLILCTVFAVITGSVVMVVAGLQSFAELTSAGMLLYGRRYANKRPTKLHPFGFGKELYYWLTLAVFVLVGAVAVIAVERGYSQLLAPMIIQHIGWGIGALAVALLGNIYSLRSSIIKLLDGQPLRTAWKAFLSSPLIATKTTVVLDIMGVTTGLFGIIGLAIYEFSNDIPQVEGVAAMVMGFSLGLFAFIVPLSVRTFVTGQSAPPETERRIRDAARAVPEVKHVLGLRTMVLSSDKLMVDIDVHFRDGLSTDQVEAAVERVKEAIEATGEGMRVHVEPDPYVDVHTS